MLSLEFVVVEHVADHDHVDIGEIVLEEVHWSEEYFVSHFFALDVFGEGVAALRQVGHDSFHVVLGAADC